jgi:D-alanyl-D-alanine carboxypeptidase
MRALRPLVAVAASVALVLGASVAPAIAATPTPDDGFDRTARSLTDPASTWVIVNKLHPLKPKSFAPADLVTVPVPHANPVKLRKPAASALVRMFRAYTKATGKKMQSQSAYRSYSAQVSTYNGWVSRLGKKAADLTSARPGFSEHQTGLAIDISAVGGTCSLRSCFAATSQGTWLAKNAWKYGFILRYPKGETDVTGYEFEPWHYRYIGVTLAADYHSSGATTLEQYFGLPAAPDYLK